MADSARPLRRNETVTSRDTTPLRILSLDGGGVRGYSMLIILQELMHRLFVEIEGRAPKRAEIPKPCDHFDLIAGTGTGGLIAIMLGRLRLDLETCKDLYVRMTRRVFETDKTFAGIPYKSTMFKASKLEEVIKEVVREHTVSAYEGNDTLANAAPMSPDTATVASEIGVSPATPFPQRTMSQSSRYSQFGASPISARTGTSTFGGPLALGNPNALMYDTRESRTKTAVTAVLRGTPVSTLLRSYDSRVEPASESECKIWQAGRATSAIALAFKPIQIGQSWYLDEGAGKYNPSPLILDEAVQNEWPGRKVGVFVSIGTGKRPRDSSRPQADWWEGFLGGTVGEFAEARRRLIAKLEACEETHEFMLREYLPARGVDKDSYYRLNVEVGVGEFGMNEWARLADVSTSTRTYLARRDVQTLNQTAAVKMADIHFAKLHDRRQGFAAQNQAPESRGSADYQQQRSSWQSQSWDRPPQQNAVPPPSNPIAVELPGDDTYLQSQGFRPGAQHYEYRPSIADLKYSVVANDSHLPQDSASPPQRPVGQHYSPSAQQQQQQQQPQYGRPYPEDGQPTRQSHHTTHTQNSPSASYQDIPSSQHQQQQQQYSAHSPPPPLPPKTPISGIDNPSSPASHWQPSPSSASSDAGGGPRTFMNMGDLGRRLPYPDIEGPPPKVNPETKPQIPR